jgi:hypothetical protein
MGEELCFPELTPTCGVLELRCQRPGGIERVSQVTFAQAAPRIPETLVVSGGRVLAMGATSGCCFGTSCASEPENVYFDADGTSGFVNLFSDKPGSTFPSLRRALPLGGGAFALGAEDFSGARSTGFYHFGADRSVSQPWPMLRDFAQFGELISGRLPAQQLLSLAPQGATQTALARHAAGAAPAVALLPASFTQESPTDGYADSSGVPTSQGVAVLLRVTEDVGALASLDDAGRPRWIYRYDRKSSIPDGDLVAGTPESGLVYLVDLRRQRVVALYP